MNFQKEWPLVTVATLCYNTGKYVIEALECVVRQGYPNIQHIIVDDCSQDDSAEMVASWIEANHYACEYIRHKENMGVQETLKEIFLLSKGKYWATISDDLWPDNKLIEQVTIFEGLDESYAMVYGDTEMIDKDGKVLVPSMFVHYRGENFMPPSGKILNEIVVDFYFLIQASIIRMSHFQDLNYRFSKDVISEDWDWQIRIAHKFNICGCKEIYGKYRWLDTSIGRTNWIPEKMHKVLRSHLIMLLNCYQDFSGVDEDQKILLARIVRTLNELVDNPYYTNRYFLTDHIRIYSATKSTYILRRIWHSKRRLLLKKW